jgi:aminotransferase EvaB
VHNEVALNRQTSISPSVDGSRLQTVPFNDLSRNAATLWASMSSAWDDALRSGWVVFGTGVRQFQDSFADYLGGGECIGVASGTDALELALRGVGVGRGRRVALAANAGFYTSAALAMIGAEPVYVDVAPGSIAPGRAEIEAAIAGGDIDAVVVTHLYGLATPDVAEIAATCRHHGCALIEDCSQSHGARLNGTMTGAFGDAAAFSFYPTKNLGALGDGGAVFTRRPDVAERARSLRQYGWSSKYVVVDAGGRNSRLDEVQALVLSAGLLQLDQRNARRRQIVGRYRVAAPAARFLGIADDDDAWVAHLCVVAVEERDTVRDRLRARGVTTDVQFPIPDHRQPVWGGSRPEVLPHTDRLTSEVLSVPCFPDMTELEIEIVGEALADVLG